MEAVLADSEANPGELRTTPHVAVVEIDISKAEDTISSQQSKSPTENHVIHVPQNVSVKSANDRKHILINILINIY